MLIKRDFLFFTKNERICKILKNNEDIIQINFYVILQNSNCNSINDLEIVEQFVINIMNKVSQKVILESFIIIFHKGDIECTKYQYQVNEPLNYNIENTLIFHQFLVWLL